MVIQFGYAWKFGPLLIGGQAASIPYIYFEPTSEASQYIWVNHNHSPRQVKPFFGRLSPLTFSTWKTHEIGGLVRCYLIAWKISGNETRPLISKHIGNWKIRAYIWYKLISDIYRLQTLITKHLGCLPALAYLKKPTRNRIFQPCPGRSRRPGEYWSSGRRLDGRTKKSVNLQTFSMEFPGSLNRW